MDVHDEMVEIGYGTYGSFGQYGRSIAILRDGTVVNPEIIGRKTWRGDSFKMNINGVEVEVYDRSSRKNKHVIVRIPREFVHAVICDSASSSGWRGFTVKLGSGKVIGEIERAERINGNKKIIIEKKVYHYVDEKIRVKIYESDMGFKTELIGKPKITLKKVKDGYIVSGDTYHIREQLKTLGAKWDSWNKTWKLSIDQDIQKLMEIADVVEVKP